MRPTDMTLATDTNENAEGKFPLALESGKRLHTRRATEADWPRMVEMFRLWHEESYLSDTIPFSEAKANAMAEKALGEDPAHIAVAVEHDGVVVGGLYAFAGEYYLGDETLVTTIHGFFVDPGIRKSILSGKIALRLFRAAKQWSDHMGAKCMLFHVTSGVKAAQTDRFLRKLGCRPLGGNYVV